MNKLWTEAEIDWLKVNFPLYGDKYLSDNSKFSYQQIKNKGKSMGLKKSAEVREQEAYGIDDEDAFDVEDFGEDRYY